MAEIAVPYDDGDAASAVPGYLTADGGRKSPMGVTGYLNGSGEAVPVTLLSALPVHPGTGTAWSVTGTFWQATQPVSVASIPLAADAATATLQGTGNASLASIDGKIPSLVTGRVPVDGSGVTQPVSGTFWQATQPVSGPLTDAELRASPVPVSLASVPSHAVTNAGVFAVQVTAALPAGTNAIGSVEVTSSALPSGAASATKQDTIIAGLASIDGHVDGVEGSLASIDAKVTACNTGAVVVSSSVLPTNAATSARQDTGNTSLSSIDAKLPALGQALAAASVPVVLTAAQLTTLTPPAAITGFATEVTLSSLNGKVTACNTGAVVLAAGTAAFGKLAANSGVDIGDVDVTSVPANPFGVNADAASATGSISAKLRFIASTGIPITGTVTVASHAVTNAGTFAVQESGTALTRLTDIETNTDSGAVVGNGAAATAQRVTLANDSTGVIATVTSLTRFNGVAIALNSGDVDAGTLRTREAGAPSLTCGQVSVGTTATQIVAARAGRKCVTITQHGTKDVFLGGVAVTTGDGTLLTGTAGAVQVFPGSSAVYGIVSAGTQTVSYAEVY